MFPSMLGSKFLSNSIRWKYRVPSVGFKGASVIGPMFSKSHTPLCPKGQKSTGCTSVLINNPKKAVGASCGLGANKLSKSSGKSGSTKPMMLKRALPPKVRLGFLPEEWFTFMHQKTGVSGPYILCLVLVNYLVSKEFYVMEHEYYSGLSIVTIVIFVYKKMGDGIATYLDKMVDANKKGLEDERKMELSIQEKIIIQSKDAQWRAKGQKLLIDAKKENVLMQLEAAYRDRAMQVYRSVKGRLDYQVKRSAAEVRFHQKWMVQWILDNVNKAITPEFQKSSLASAIADLEAMTKSAK